MIIAAAAFASSCVSVLPANTPNVPLLKEKGDARMTTNFVKSGAGFGGSVQAAFSPADKFYLGANGSFISYNDGYKSTMLEMGAGTYRRIGRDFTFDLSGGAGLGGNNTYGEYNLSRVFVQPAFGYTRNRFQVALGAKLNHTKFNEKEGKEVDEGNGDFSAKTLDPFVALRFGASKFRFQVMYTYSTLLDNKIDYVVPESTLSLGFHFFIGKKKLMH